MRRRIFGGNRFNNRARGGGGIGYILIPAATFAVVFALTMAGIRSLDGTSDEEQRKALQSVIQKSAVQCYALEGRYPESLSYLTEHYGLTYDRSRYTVSYQVFGPNILPTITVMPAEK